MELVDGLRVGRVVGKARVGDNVLTRVVALGRTVPEEEAAVKGYQSCELSVSAQRIRGSKHTYGCGFKAAIGVFADVHAVVELVGAVADRGLRNPAQQAERSQDEPWWSCAHPRCYQRAREIAMWCLCSKLHGVSSFRERSTPAGFTT
jgi:hypothetical protein